METILIVLAVASIALNVLQWMERRADKRECRTAVEDAQKENSRLVADAALLESRYSELKADYDNEVEHRRWAIGRIKDQQTVIRQLERGAKPRKQRKEADNEGR